MTNLLARLQGINSAGGWFGVCQITTS